MNVPYNFILNMKESLNNFFSLKDIQIKDTSIRLCDDGKHADLSIHIPSFNSYNQEILLEEMKSIAWPISVYHTSIRGSHIIIQLEKCAIFARTLKTVHEKQLDLHSTKELTLCYDYESPTNDITNYRVALLLMAVKNLTQCLGYSVFENRPNKGLLYFSSKSNLKIHLNNDQKLVLCGSVLNYAKKVKEIKLQVSDYLNFKKNVLLKEMEEKDKVNVDTVNLLSEAMLKFELLRRKSSTPVLLNVHDTGSTDSVVFILYNYSRLNAIIHEFESRMSSNYYPKLPAIENVDFTLLQEKKEWKLLFDYILQFPNVIINSMKSVETGKVAPHLLCHFLYSLARTVSSYYRSTKVLLEPEPQLLNLIFARLYLVKAIHWVLFRGLELLTIKVIPAL